MARTGIEHGREFELRGGPDAVLLLHGLTGSTFEMHVVARRLAEAGMRCLAPVMAGHGGDARELLGVPWPEWVAKARRELARLEGARRTFVVGCSMGALVACALAHDHPERVDGLVLLAPALELQLHGRLGALLARLGPLSRLVVPKEAGSDVHDPEMRERNRGPTLGGVPLAAVAELTALAEHVDRQLPGIAAPALVVAGAHDHTVTVGGSRRLARRIGSGPAELVILEDSWHLVGIDVERDLCADVTARFLTGLPVPGARGSAAPGRRARGEDGAGTREQDGGTRRRGTGRRPRAR
ncbi:alpha/beta hydrolase [Anaeromyxobacter terrae]|uniref:alpha/beta hydrolase n=1 Tax=Anaeromyxobacter terrae TaxID=2925406 RepID=UPI001F5ACFF8|nr:alpha/beta fold hydrolase [Anaeromyxobacter sp. SG22]